MANPKDKPEERLTERIVVLVRPSFKEQYRGMAEAIGEDVSEHIRAAWEAELALYDSAKA